MAFVEAVVGAGLATVLFLLTLFGTAPKDSRLRRPPPPMASLVALPLLEFFCSMQPKIFLNSEIQILNERTHFTNLPPQSYEDTHTPNVVTSVLMDYRSLDTMVETWVIFTAGIACALLLRRQFLMIQPHDSTIVQTLGRFLIPVIQIFGLYVLFFGQYGPGEGLSAE